MRSWNTKYVLTAISVRIVMKSPRKRPLFALWQSVWLNVPSPVTLITCLLTRPTLWNRSRRIVKTRNAFKANSHRRRTGIRPELSWRIDIQVSGLETFALPPPLFVTPPLMDITPTHVTPWLATHMHMHTYVHTQRHVCMYTPACKYTYMQRRGLANTHTHTHIYACMEMHTQTHTHTHNVHRHVCVHRHNPLPPPHKHACISTHTQAHMYACMHPPHTNRYTHAWMQTYACTGTHTHGCKYTHIKAPLFACWPKPGVGSVRPLM